MNKYIIVILSVLFSTIPLKTQAQDCTYLIVNPTLDSKRGWTMEQKVKGEKFSYYNIGNGSGCIEAWNTSFDIYQVIKGAPNGIYTAYVQGFYREGGGAYLADPTTRLNGTEEINAYLYANQSQTQLMSIYDCAQNEMSDAFNESTVLGYVPTTMSAANSAFQQGYYSDNALTFRVTDGTIRLGIKSDKVVGGDWTIFDNFKLYYNAPLTSYVLTYMVDGKVYETYTLEEGQELPLVESPTKDGYTFVGWNIDGYEQMPQTMPDKDLIVNGMFQKNDVPADSYDYTYLIINPTLDGNRGWTMEQKVKGEKFSYYNIGSGSGCIEAWNTSFDIYQVIKGAPNGIYTAYVQGFYREGGGAYLADPTTRLNGTEEINAYLYANQSQTQLMSIYDCAQNEMSDAFNESTVLGYVPTTMSAANSAFQQGYYSDNALTFRVTDGTIRLGIKSDKVVGGDWTIFDNFKLYYNAPLTSYVLTYMVDGKVYETYTLEEGQELPLVESPTKDGYTFVGWNIDGYEQMPQTMPACNLTAIAIFAEKIYPAYEYSTDFNTTLKNGDGSLVELTNSNIYNVLYTLDNNAGDGFDIEKGCIIIYSTMPHEGVLELNNTAYDEIGSGDFSKKFNGIVFAIKAGMGEIEIDAQTFGTRQICIKIGITEPITFTLEKRGKQIIEYNTSTDSFVFVYGQNAPTVQQSRDSYSIKHSQASDNSIAIYGISWNHENKYNSIEHINHSDSDITYYTIDGRQFETLQRGINIIRTKDGHIRKINIK